MSVPLNPEKLKKCREACGITKLEAAKRTGLTQSGYVRYESGERKPTIQVVEILASTFHTSVDYLIDHTDDPSADRITIFKKQDPVLFEIANSFQGFSQEQKNRIYTYYQELIKRSNI